MRRYGAVLFDWRGTLVHYDARWGIGPALRALGRESGAEAVARIVAALRKSASVPAVAAAASTEDCSFELHHRAMLLRFEAAGLDVELAEAVDQIDSRPGAFPLFPDVAGVLARLRQAGVATAIVSNIHYDMRADLALHAIDGLVDACILSCEQGFQKPDVRMFRLALEGVGASPRDALMVGDSPVADGAAALCGIDTLILPAQDDFGPHGLDAVLRLADRDSRE